MVEPTVRRESHSASGITFLTALLLSLFSYFRFIFPGQFQHYNCWCRQRPLCYGVSPLAERMLMSRAEVKLTVRKSLSWLWESGWVRLCENGWAECEKIAELNWEQGCTDSEKMAGMTLKIWLSWGGCDLTARKWWNLSLMWYLFVSYWKICWAVYDSMVKLNARKFLSWVWENGWAD